MDQCYSSVQVGGVCNFPSSVLLQQKSEATDRPELQLSFIWQAKENTSSKHESGLIQKTQREERPMVQFWLLFLSTFFSSPKPALCKLGQPGGLFFSSEVLTLFFRPSFVPLLWAFPFHFLLATTILDSFFLFQLPNILPSRDGRPKSLEQGHQCLSGYFLLNWDRKGPMPPPVASLKPLSPYISVHLRMIDNFHISLLNWQCMFQLVDLGREKNGLDNW